MARIAFIGLGHMGGGMAPNLAKAGHEVRAFDLVRGSASSTRPKGGCARAGSAAEAVQGRRRRHHHASRRASTSAPSIENDVAPNAKPGDAC